MSENSEDQNVEFVKFWTRAGAYILDGLIIGSITICINLLNISQAKSFLLYLLIALLTALYKPFMESKYGATLGKMIFKIKVTDFNFNKISFKKSLIRSAILIFPGLLYIPIYYYAFNNPRLIEITEFVKFSNSLAVEYPIQSWIGNLSFLIIILDIIVLLSDSTKTERSLHDRIARTYVIYNK